MTMNVQDVMTRSPRSCRSSESLAAAARVLWDNDCGAVPVVDEASRPIGIVTDRDCCMAAYTRGQRLDEVPVALAMAKVVFTARHDESVASAVATMHKQKVRRLPVIDAAGKLVGMLSSADLLVRARSHLGQSLVDALASISAPRSGSTAGGSATGGRAGEPTAVVVPKAPAANPPSPPPVAAAAPQSAPANGKAKARGKKK